MPARSRNASSIGVIGHIQSANFTPHPRSWARVSSTLSSDSRVVMAARHRDVGQPLVREVLDGAVGLGANDAPALAAMACHGIAVIGKAGSWAKRLMRIYLRIYIGRYENCQGLQERQ
jgi:hypothetical protein